MWTAKLVASEKQSSDMTKLCAAQTDELLCLRAKFADTVQMAETAAAVGEREAAKARRHLVEIAEVTRRAVSRAERAELQVEKLRNQFKAAQILFASINVELQGPLAPSDPVETRDSAGDKVPNHIAAARRSHSEGSENFRPVEADLIAAATVLIKFAFGFRVCEAEAGAHRLSAHSPPQHAERPARSDGADGPRDIVDH